MKLLKTEISEVVVVDPNMFCDSRGWFMESFNERRFHDGLRELGLTPPRPFVQDNHSCSAKGVVRGLHYQAAPFPQGKLVRVVRGSAYDVAVDIRRGSPTFGRWVGVELNERTQRSLWIPEGFAHGFIALEDDTHFLYKTTDYYAPQCERALRWNDPDIGIEWPCLEGTSFILADKDANAPTIKLAREAGDLLE